jgi:hypothetical protein
LILFGFIPELIRRREATRADSFLAGDWPMDPIRKQSPQDGIIPPNLSPERLFLQSRLHTGAPQGRRNLSETITLPAGIFQRKFFAFS